MSSTSQSQEGPYLLELSSVSGVALWRMAIGCVQSIIRHHGPLPLEGLSGSIGSLPCRVFLVPKGTLALASMALKAWWSCSRNVGRVILADLLCVPICCPSRFSVLCEAPSGGCSSCPCHHRSSFNCIVPLPIYFCLSLSGQPAAV